CKLVSALGASYVARWTTAHPVQLAKSIAEGMEHKGFSFIEVLSQCPVQAGKSVFGEKDPAAIMKRYKEGTYLYKEGGEPVEGKIPIGVFKHDTNAEEYIERVERRLRDQGIERG
ncbi:MAG: 2-oxoacid:ferredoxin oxidoreductase subunit beta, partial [Firmicutes bacterium]|nr:2-oxoacid:ferredoxin oxidoreductase subunit beta [Bacillota bacterium]